MSPTVEPAITAEGPSRCILLVLVLLGAFGPLATDMYLAAFPQMQASLGTDAGGVAATLSVYVLGMALGQLVYGPLSDRFGRRLPLLGGIAVFCAATAGLVVVTRIDLFMLLRLVQALGGCCGVVLGRAIVGDLASEASMARSFSLLSMMSMIAPIAAPSLGVVLLELGSWRLIFAVMLAYGLLAAGLAWTFVPESLPPERRRAELGLGGVLRTFGELLSTREVCAAAVLGGSAAAALFAFITGSSQVLQVHFGLDRVSYALAFSAVVAALMAGSWINRRVVRHVPARRILGWVLPVQVLTCGILLAGAEAAGPAIFAVLLIVILGSTGMILPNATALAVSAGRHVAGSASSVLGVLQFGCGFASSALLALMGADSVTALACVLLGSSLLGLGAMLVLRRA